MKTQTKQEIPRKLDKYQDFVKAEKEKIIKEYIASQAKTIGCGGKFHVSQLDPTVYTCGKSELNGKSWLCDDCFKHD